LSPALCALLLKPHQDRQRLRLWERPIRAFFGAFNWGFDRLALGYGWLAARVVRYTVIMLAIYVGVIAFGLRRSTAAI
jgi:multidrug efflux pump subunit AcrB